jgi:hypothetical protein
MNRERTQKIQRLAALKAFREQQARQVFVTAKAESNRRANVEACLSDASDRHQRGLETVYAEPMFDVARYELLRERSAAAGAALVDAGKALEEAEAQSDGASMHWRLQRVAAETITQRATLMQQEDEVSEEKKRAAELIDLWLARAR